MYFSDDSSWHYILILMIPQRDKIGMVAIHSSDQIKRQLKPISNFVVLLCLVGGYEFF